MALLRKDVRVAFIAAGALGLAGVGYVGVLLFSGGDEETAAADTNDAMTAWDPVVNDAPIQGLSDGPSLEDLGVVAQDTPSLDTGDDVWGDEVLVTTTTVPSAEPESEDKNDDLAAKLANFGKPAESATPTPTDRAFDTAAREHILAEGDTFVSLSEQYYGSDAHFDTIRRANPSLDPRRLKIGDLIVIPSLDSAGKPRGLPAINADPTTHTVRPGETLSDIARSRLGRSALWNDVYELNRDLIGDDPARLKVGMVLRLPQ
ncbi:MAG: LysM domain-containing protein [Planctomycetota bacterium]